MRTHHFLACLAIAATLLAAPTALADPNDTHLPELAAFDVDGRAFALPCLSVNCVLREVIIVAGCAADWDPANDSVSDLVNCL